MTMRRLAAVLTTAALATGVLAGCGSENWAKKCTTKDTVVECAPGRRTPIKKDVKGQLLDGTSYDLAGDKGKVVVVNFWGSWCAPCRAEADDLEKTYQETKSKGVAFLGIDSRDDKDAAKAFVRGRATYPSIYDSDGKVALQFDVTQVATPQTLVLDRQGRIAYAIRDATVYTQLLPMVQRVAAEANG
ncbi:TlpA disulfide reductase family protein [Actinoplanes sp. NPDC051343]|uniref:TlpA disulfide reductase family protein n=1 Tax=Actinoplanes sp. NPDC051343 TaxID=3363906 RepID=UPI0037BC7F61